MFFLAVWFQQERGEALQDVAIMRHVFISMVKLAAKNDMEAKFRGLVIVVQVLVVMRDWLW
jgi:hypothetical protein